jgi:hypothetical protein
MASRPRVAPARPARGCAAHNAAMSPLIVDSLKLAADCHSAG